MRFFNSFKFELLNILKAPLTYILYFICLAGLGISLQQNDNSLFLISSTSFYTQGLFLGFIILGVYLRKKEKYGNMEEVLCTINNAMVFKLLSKIAVVLFLIGIYLISSTLLFCIFQKGFISSFYVEFFKYNLLYSGLTLIIPALMGYLLGSLFHNRFVYILSLLVWFIFTPINNFLSIILGMFNVNSAFSIGDFLNLLQHNQNNVPNSTYGLSLESYQIDRRLLFIFFFIFLNFIIMYKQNILKKKTFKILSIPFIFCIGLFSFNTFKPQQVLTYFQQNNSITKQESNHYENINATLKYSENFTPLEYILDFNINRNLSSKVLIKAKNISNTQENSIHFLLYYGFDVEKVSLEDGTPLSFNREGDNLFITLNKDILPGEMVSLNIKYRGVSSPQNYATKKAIYLTNNFAYFPIISGYDSSMENEAPFYGSFRKVNITPNTKVKYTLKLKDTKNIYTNLEKIDNNTFSGYSNSGLIILKGLTTYEKIQGINTVFPIEYTKDKTLIIDTVNLIKKATTVLNKDFNLNNTIDNLFMFEENNGNTAPSSMGGYSNGLLVIPEDNLKTQEKISVLPSLVSNLTWRNLDINTTNFESLRLFDLAYTEFLIIRLKEDKFFSKFSEFYENVQLNIDFLKDRNDMELIPYFYAANDISKFLESSKDLEVKIEFFKGWFEKIKSNKVPTDVEIKNAIIKGWN